MALISLEHVSKVYPKGTRPALDDINLDIDRGDFVFLVGASGSGKTTLLSLLLREEEATDGEIRVAGNCRRWGSQARKTTTPMSCPAAKRNASPSQGRM